MPRAIREITGNAGTMNALVPVLPVAVIAWIARLPVRPEDHRPIIAWSSLPRRASPVLGPVIARLTRRMDCPLSRIAFINGQSQLLYNSFSYLLTDMINKPPQPPEIILDLVTEMIPKII
jgi:hypothetical protein